MPSECPPLLKGHQPESSPGLWPLLTQQTAGVKPQKWEHSSSANARKDGEAQGTAQSFLQGWGSPRDGTNSKEKRQKISPIWGHLPLQRSPQEGCGAGGMFRAAGGWGCL